MNIFVLFLVFLVLFETIRRINEKLADSANTAEDEYRKEYIVFSFVSRIILLAVFIVILV